MPLYDYHCDECGDFRGWRNMSDYDQDIPCPDCDGVAGRMVTAPSLARMPSNNRIAHARNEKSADQPQVVSKSRVGQTSHNGYNPHSHGERCHGHQRSGAAPPHGRPWMVGH